MTVWASARGGRWSACAEVLRPDEVPVAGGKAVFGYFYQPLTTTSALPSPFTSSRLTSPVSRLAGSEDDVGDGVADAGLD
ncbi:hypothetical protein H1V43_18670 [Streptomyces sp. PSKA54]|uniref:Uncharacterized protein n=1 Tax=Streptomyces himalayensis subsp. aureolus TaxID=2758039 RepID=A0A7W2HH39_9ACTN|nr:hypothetical protein [Streptomyces himalayensis]MBA4863369.1 hypothetical protein [Streptomyces himalayensis subsp. aureolus]